MFMRSLSWIMAGIAIGVGLAIMMMNEYKEAEKRHAEGHRADEHRTDEEWPLGKSFDWEKKETVTTAIPD
jgi:hypothetical protein